jgi:hypothetical protein
VSRHTPDAYLKFSNLFCGRPQEREQVRYMGLYPSCSPSALRPKVNSQNQPRPLSNFTLPTRAQSFPRRGTSPDTPRILIPLPPTSIPELRTRSTAPARHTRVRPCRIPPPPPPPQDKHSHPYSPYGAPPSSIGWCWVGLAVLSCAVRLRFFVTEARTKPKASVGTRDVADYWNQTLPTPYTASGPRNSGSLAGFGRWPCLAWPRLAACRPHTHR